MATPRRPRRSPDGTPVREINCSVNRRRVRREIPVDRLLRDFVRDDLGLTGTKGACQDGMCGSCSLHLDGRVVKSCLVLAVQADGRSVTTVEGISGPELHPVQRSLAERFAVQCGFCTPGFVMTLAAILEDDPDPEVEGLREALAGNICRCTGYVRIVDAGMQAAARVRASRAAAPAGTA